MENKLEVNLKSNGMIAHSSQHYGEFCTLCLCQLIMVVCVQITSTVINQEGSANVTFYVGTSNGSAIPAAQAAQTLNLLSAQEMSAYMGAEVCRNSVLI